MHDKRFRTFTELLRQQFGCRVQRVSLDTGLSCPNRDGSISLGGCSFCNDRGSAAVGVPTELSLADQLARSKVYLRRKFRAEKFLGYFQAYTNTYASSGQLRELYETVLADPEIVGLIIGTRPDCLPDPVLDLLEDLHQRTYLWIELGMQTMHDHSLQALNRGHNHACLKEAVDRCKIRGLRVCLHLILGLPGEGREEMLASVGEVNRLGVAGIKLHHLHVLRGSRLEEEYRQGRLRLFELDEYVQLVCDAIEILDPGIVIHRLMGDGRSELVAPDWSRRKLEVLNRIDAELIQRDSRQGGRLSEKATIHNDRC